MTTCSAVFIQYQRVTDRQTDRRTDGQTELLYRYRASVCWRTIKASQIWTFNDFWFLRYKTFLYLSLAWPRNLDFDLVTYRMRLRALPVAYSTSTRNISLSLNFFYDFCSWDRQTDRRRNRRTATRNAAFYDNNMHHFNCNIWTEGLFKFKVTRCHVSSHSSREQCKTKKCLLYRSDH